MTVTASNPSMKDTKKLEGNFAKDYSEMLKIKYVVLFQII